MNDREDAADAEGSVREAWANGQESAAVSMARKLYGAEVYGLLLGLCRVREEADDAFSLFAEGLWQSLKTVECHCSLRTWALAVVERKLSYVTIRIGADARVEGLEVRLDGTLFREPSWGSERPIDPGEHSLMVTAPGPERYETTFTIKGEASMAVSARGARLLHQ
jgi:hypothetical protein